MARRKKETELLRVGWREWVALPGLGVERIKAKVDTGARSSSLHAYRIRPFEGEDGEEWIRFLIHPIQRNTRITVEAVAPLLERRTVRSSNGLAESRPVIRTLLRIGGKEWPIDLNLTSRDAMGFRLLLGREAVRGRGLVDPGSSFLCGR